MMLHNFSRHQATILQILAEEVTDEFWGLPVTMLSRKAARRLETKPGSYIVNQIERRKRRRSEEVNRFHKGEIDRDTLDFMLWCHRDSPRRLAETLTEKWRATFSRSLKRLERRGLIIRSSGILTEKQEGEWYSVRYIGGRTYRVCLTPEGREIGERELLEAEE